MLVREGVHTPGPGLPQTNRNGRADLFGNIIQQSVWFNTLDTLRKVLGRRITSTRSTHQAIDLASDFIERCLEGLDCFTQMCQLLR